MSDTPLLDDLVDPTDPERERLAAVHDLLLAVGPPPELPPSLQTAPAVPLAKAGRFRRRRATGLAAIAIAAAVLLGLGYAIGGRDTPSSPVLTLTLVGPAGATGSIMLQPVDGAGNWPVRLTVSGLPPLPEGASYSLWLTRNGTPARPCGAFLARWGSTEVWLNAPVELDDFDGWAVVRTGTKKPFLLRTPAV